ncbi:hypothetical protein BLOT_005127 [Blomia tropicalis]|nr:hypothetical protein BLOT_005127 [Blomia tropicalis]
MSVVRTNSTNHRSQTRIRILIERMEYCKSKHLELKQTGGSERDESTTSSSRFEPMVSKLRNGNGRCSFRSNPITGK